MYYFVNANISKFDFTCKPLRLPTIETRSIYISSHFYDIIQALMRQKRSEMTISGGQPIFNGQFASTEYMQDAMVLPPSPTNNSNSDKNSDMVSQVFDLKKYVSSAIQNYN